MKITNVKINGVPAVRRACVYGTAAVSLLLSDGWSDVWHITRSEARSLRKGGVRASVVVRAICGGRTLLRHR